MAKREDLPLDSEEFDFRPFASQTTESLTHFIDLLQRRSFERWLDARIDAKSNNGDAAGLYCNDGDWVEVAPR